MATGTRRTFSQRWADHSLVSRLSSLNSVNIIRLIFMFSLCRRWSFTPWFRFRWDNKHRASNVGVLGNKKITQTDIPKSAFEVPCKLGCIGLWLFSGLAHRQKKNCYAICWFLCIRCMKSYSKSDIPRELNSAQDYLKLHQSFLKAL